MHSEMKNQRSSPLRPFFFTSARQALSFGRLAFHLARISLIFSRVSVSLDFFGSGAAVCASAGAAMIVAEIKIAAAMEVLVRNITFFSPRFVDQKIRAALL